MPNSSVRASAPALPITRRFVLCSMVAAPVALAPTLRTLSPAFDAKAFVAALRQVGVTVAPCHSLGSFFIGYGTRGFSDEFFAAADRFANAYKADPRADQKIYAALCAEEAADD